MSEYIVELTEDNRDRILGLCDGIHNEIVRCKDCRFFTPKGSFTYRDGMINQAFCGIVRSYRVHITPDDFCAWGERKE